MISDSSSVVVPNVDAARCTAAGLEKCGLLSNPVKTQDVSNATYRW